MHCAYSVLGNSSDAYLLHAHSIIHIFSRCPLHAHQKHVSPGAFCILISQHTLKRPSPPPLPRNHTRSVHWPCCYQYRGHTCAVQTLFPQKILFLPIFAPPVADWLIGSPPNMCSLSLSLSLSLSPYKCTFQRKKGTGQSGSWLTDWTIHFKSRRFHSSHVHRPGQWPL